MTVSSLAKQLQVIQQQDRIIRGPPAGQTKRPSFLFDEREAAGYNNESILQLGKEGLASLCQVDPTLRPFEDYLFNSDLLDIDISALTSQERKDLDQKVEEFLILLSPHFQEKACHKVLEWMIRKWRVNEVNVDALMTSILPHHDSLAFVRMVQIIYFTNTSRWSFLFEKVKQGGSTIHRTLLAQRCTVDNSIMGRVINGFTVLHRHQQKYPTYTHISMYISFMTHLMLEYITHAQQFTDVEAINTFQRVDLLMRTASDHEEVMVGIMMVFMSLADRARLSPQAIQYMIRKFIKYRQPRTELHTLLTLVRTVQAGYLERIEDEIVMDVASLTIEYWDSLVPLKPRLFLQILLANLQVCLHPEAPVQCHKIKTLNNNID